MRRIQTLPLWTLTDTGPLVALADRDDPNATRAQQQLQSLPQVPLLTLWPCMTETMHLLGKVGGYRAQSEMLNFLNAGAVQLWRPDETQAAQMERRVVELMAAYRDIPCDFADAALVAAAEILNVRRLFTFDSHFYAYQTDDDDALEVLPGPAR